MGELLCWGGAVGATRGSNGTPVEFGWQNFTDPRENREPTPPIPVARFARLIGF
jgi:hypothetical protein